MFIIIVLYGRNYRSTDEVKYHVLSYFGRKIHTTLPCKVKLCIHNSPVLQPIVSPVTCLARKPPEHHEIRSCNSVAFNYHFLGYLDSAAANVARLRSPLLPFVSFQYIERTTIFLLMSVSELALLRQVFPYIGNLSSAGLCIHVSKCLTGYT